MAFILGYEVLKISCLVLNAADLILFIDNVAVGRLERHLEGRYLSSPQSFEVGREDWVFGETAGKTSKHDDELRTKWECEAVGGDT